MAATDEFKEWLRKTPTKVLFETLIAEYPGSGSWDEFALAVEKIRKFQPSGSEMYLTTTLKAAYFMFMSDDYKQYVTALQWAKSALTAAEDAMGSDSEYTFWALNLVSQICLSVEAKDGGGEIQSQNYALDLLQRQQTLVLENAFRPSEPIPEPISESLDYSEPDQNGLYPVPQLPSTIRVAPYSEEDENREFDSENWREMLILRDVDAETFVAGTKLLIERMTPISPPEVFSAIATVLQDLGRDEEAMAYLLRGVSENPSSELLNAALGLAIGQASTGDQLMRNDAITLLKRAYSISRNKGSYSWDQLLNEIATLNDLPIDEDYPLLSETFREAAARLCDSGLLGDKGLEAVLRWAGNAVEEGCLQTTSLTEAAWGILVAVNKRFAPRRALTVAWDDPPEDVLHWTQSMLEPHGAVITLKKAAIDQTDFNDYFLSVNDKQFEISLQDTTHLIQPINWGLEDCGVDLQFHQLSGDGDICEFLLLSQSEHILLQVKGLV